MWVYFVAGFILGGVCGFMGISLATSSKQREYEDKLWELERLKWRLENENRE